MSGSSLVHEEPSLRLLAHLAISITLISIPLFLSTELRDAAESRHYGFFTEPGFCAQETILALCGLANLAAWWQLVSVRRVLCSQGVQGSYAERILSTTIVPVATPRLLDYCPQGLSASLRLPLRNGEPAAAFQCSWSDRACPNPYCIHGQAAMDCSHTVQWLESRRAAACRSCHQQKKSGVKSNWTACRTGWNLFGKTVPSR